GDQQLAGVVRTRGVFWRSRPLRRLRVQDGRVGWPPSWQVASAEGGGPRLSASLPRRRRHQGSSKAAHGGPPPCIPVVGPAPSRAGSFVSTALTSNLHALKSLRGCARAVWWKSP